MELWMASVMFISIWICSFCVCGLDDIHHALGEYSRPCIHEGVVETDSNWQVLANISILDSGRMTFQFSYPAVQCCYQILFYLEDQISVLNRYPRMDCWQRESILDEERAQSLLLTSRSVCSGCHMIHPGGVPTIACHGGRSLPSQNPQTQLTSWYIAVSNCNSLHGLQLTYHLEFFGHNDECQTAEVDPVTPEPSHIVVTSQLSNKLHVIEGTLDTDCNWYCYLANLTLQAGGGFNFKLTYPFSRQVQNIILYNENDINKIKTAQTCWEKEGIIRSRDVPNQIMELSIRSSVNGCVTRNSSEGNVLSCEGMRRYNNLSHIFIAVTNCRSRTGVVLQYRFEVFDFGHSLDSLYVSTATRFNIKLNVSLGMLFFYCKPSITQYMYYYRHMLKWIHMDNILVLQEQRKKHNDTNYYITTYSIL